MKRKIAAILAADIAGYSRLVAEDEEETLRRLASYRSVTDDFIAKAGGRIFNTAGDAVLAEFPSAVEAVRCAIDIQESLRTRNMAYPPSRQMSFRIGITIGDVVERDGDLLGDGVNIAARLEGIAEIGGICISRAVHEQVANKLSVQFSDIGAQEVKNIPTPVHAYMVAMRREDGTYAAVQPKKPISAKPSSGAAPNWMWPVAVMVVCLVAIGVGGFLYFTKLELRNGARHSAVAGSNATSVPSTTPVAAPPVTPSAAASAPPSSLPPLSSGEKFAAESVPFVTDRIRAVLANEYVAAAEPKAFALNLNGIIGLSSSQPNEEAGKSAALELCQKRADNVKSPRKCELYAVDSAVVYPHGKPPVPPLPWIRRDPSTEKPFASKDMPFARGPGKARLETNYVPAKKSKAIVVGPGRNFTFYTDGATVAEVVRRTLETCGSLAGAPCMVVAVDDVFVVPVPTIMRPTGFFKASDNSSIAADAREDVAHQLAESPSGWNAVAVGSSGRPGMALKASNEQDAVNGALSDCTKRDSNCRVIAIGPFEVGPN
jgi:adenylate cyclase